MSAEAEELYSLLIPLAEDRLIIPRVCVAEVIRYSKPEQEPGSHDWMLGSINWNGRVLPVVSFEGTIGKDIPAVTGRTRIVIFYAVSGQLKAGHFGVLTQGFPQLVRVNSEVLKFDATKDWPEGTPALCRVKMINEYPLVPHLEILESMLVEESVQA
jgi:chemosensory pili system protein ChpC